MEFYNPLIKIAGTGLQPICQYSKSDSCVKTRLSKTVSNILWVRVLACSDIDGRNARTQW
jgi:hypothetical protein